MFERLREWWNDNPHDRATKKFVKGARLVNKWSGEFAVVLYADPASSYAMIQYADGDRRTIDWMTPAGTARTDVIDAWKVVDEG